jgi:hypothetical protein
MPTTNGRGRERPRGDTRSLVVFLDQGRVGFGANLSGCNGGTQPVAYFGLHGIHDSVLNISNGRSFAGHFRQEQRLHRTESA